MTETTKPSKSPKRGRKIMIAAGVVGAMLAAGAATTAVSHVGFDKSVRHLSVEAGYYGDMVQKARFFHRRPKNVEQAQKRAERMAKHFAIEVDATTEQTGKLVELARGVAADVFPIRQSIKDARKKGLDLLSSNTVDRQGMEALREEQFEKIEAVSKRVTTAIADAAEVLNAEQRKDLAERIAEWRGKRGHGWHGRRGHDRF